MVQYKKRGVRALGEAIVTRMLEDEYAVVAEHATFEHHIREFLQSLQSVGWVSKDDVEPTVGATQEVKHIGAHHMHVIHPEALGLALHIVGAGGIDIDACHLTCAT